MVKKRSKAKMASVKRAVVKVDGVKVDKAVVKTSSAETKKTVKKGRFGVLATFKFIFGNFKLFLPLLLIAVIICALTSGMSEDAVVVLMVIAFLILWMTTLFFARRVMAGEKVRFRDGLYNAMTPLVSTLLVFVVLAIQCIPLMLVVIGYSAAVETNLFGDMFYGSLFVLFALLMVVISGYLLSGTFMGLIAVSAPGMYPLRALGLSHELMMGKRVQFVLRMFVMLVVLVLVGVVITGPAVLVDLALKSWAGVVLPMLVPIFVMTAICAMVIYMTVYLYIYYRELLEYE